MDAVDANPAKSDGRLQHGDELVEVDGQSLIGPSFEECLAIIKATPGRATFNVKKRREVRDALTLRREGALTLRRESALAGGAVGTTVAELAVQSQTDDHPSAVHNETGSDVAIRSVGTESHTTGCVATESSAPQLTLSELLTMHEAEVDSSKDASSSTDLDIIIIDLQEPSDQGSSHPPLVLDQLRDGVAPRNTANVHHHPLEMDSRIQEVKGTGYSNEEDHRIDAEDDDDDDDLTDVTDTEMESCDEALAPPPPLPTSPIPEQDTPTHSHTVDDQ